jgi:hypothetical protein
MGTAMIRGVAVLVLVLQACNPQVARHTASDAQFDRLLRRDLSAHFGGAAVSYELLRREPTQSGVAYPKYYAWVRVQRDDGLLEGAVRLAAVDDERLVVTHFLQAQEIVTSPGLIESVFPEPLLETIRDRARRRTA